MANRFSADTEPIWNFLFFVFTKVENSKDILMWKNVENFSRRIPSKTRSDESSLWRRRRRWNQQSPGESTVEIFQNGRRDFVSPIVPLASAAPQPTHSRSTARRHRRKRHRRRIQRLSAQGRDNAQREIFPQRRVLRPAAATVWRREQ